MGARNFVSVEVKPETGGLEFDLRVEQERGGGKTKSYVSRYFEAERSSADD